MEKKYMVWWHNYIDEIDRDNPTLKDVLKSVKNVMNDLEKLKKLEENGKIKVKYNTTINPLLIEIINKSVESDIAKNPIVDVIER